jgi:hypothetical protein
VPDELISLAVADFDMGMSGDVQFNEKPTVKIEPIYVQFEDGSTWGDASVYGEKFRRNRADALDWLIGLHNTATDEQFNALLEKKFQTSPLRDRTFRQFRRT